MADEAPKGVSAAGVLVPQWSLVTIALVVFVARMHLRINVKREKVQLSDISMLGACMFGIASSAFDVRFAVMGVLDGVVTNDGTGYTGPDPEATLIEMLKLFWWSGWPYLTTLYLCKMTLLLLYVNLIPVFMRKRRYFLWSTMVYVNAAWIASLSIMIWPCLPVERNWSIDPETVCPPEASAYGLLISWPLHFVGDVLVFILPWTVVPGLQLEIRMRMIVYATFALGAINISFVIVRFFNLIQAASQTEWRMPLSNVELWSILDLNVSLVVCGLPSLGAYFRKAGQGSSASQRRRAHNQPRSQHDGQLSGGHGPTSKEIRNPAGSYNELDGGYNRRKRGMFTKLKEITMLSTFNMSMNSTTSDRTMVGDGDGDGDAKKGSGSRGVSNESDVELVRVQTGSEGTDRKGSDAKKEEEVIVFQRPYYGRLDADNNV